MPTMPTAALARQSPSLQLLPAPSGPVPPYRPHLRVVEGGRSLQRLARRRTLRRRRAVVLALLATVVVAVVLLGGAASTRLAGGGHPSAAAGASSPTSAVALRAAEVAATSWVVAPGDTLWSIAARVAPDADVRETVDRLVELNGKRPIYVGQHLRLP
jgi:nucleoid-associated protein YgaU